MRTEQAWGWGWMAAFLGFPPAGLAAEALIGALETPLEGLIGGAAAGVVIGLAGWLALRTRFGLGIWWIPATAAGLALGLTLSTAIFGAGTDLNAVLQRAPLTGLLLGAAQALVLRGYVRGAVLWVVAVTLVYPLSWFITANVIGASMQNGYVVFGASGALVFQALMGLTLWQLSKRTTG